MKRGWKRCPSCGGWQRIATLPADDLPFPPGRVSEGGCRCDHRLIAAVEDRYAQRRRERPPEPGRDAPRPGWCGPEPRAHPSAPYFGGVQALY